MQGDRPARLVLTDEPYNVKISGHVTGGGHREFAMALGEMTNAEFLAFNGERLSTQKTSPPEPEPNCRLRMDASNGSQAKIQMVQSARWHGLVEGAIIGIDVVYPAAF